METYMKIKIEEQYLKFPRSLPNDLELFLVYYPRKFPGIVPYYEEVVQKIANDPQGFREYGDWVREELFEGFKKIKNDYDNGDQDDLDFLLSIDQRFHKLICYRFWIVNYLCADGPLHDYFVDNLRSLIYKFVDVENDVEEFENKFAMIQRDLLQGDYADLYLQQALSGNRLMGLIKEDEKIIGIIERADVLIREDAGRNIEKINAIWDELIAEIRSVGGELLKTLEIPLEQAEMRNSMNSVYNMLTHTVEFKKENESLAKRHGEMKNRIEELKQLAKEKLFEEEYELFVLAVEQIRNFTEYKDVMGEIDTVLLPLWFGIHNQMKEILIKNGVGEADRKISTGHSAVFYHYVWYLPDNLKAKIMTIDKTPFDLSSL
jgi:hypothetical protein